MERIIQLVPKFDGKGNPIEWLYKLEASFELLEIKPNIVLPYLILLLEGEAYLWYSTITDFTMYSSLDEFREKFLDWFLPPNHKTLDKLSSVKYNSELGFKRFITELNHNFSQLNYLSDDLAKLQWFIRNLSKGWQIHFINLKFKSYQECCYYAINLDSIPNLKEPNLDEDLKNEVINNNELNIDKPRERTSFYANDKLTLSRSLAAKNKNQINYLGNHLVKLTVNDSTGNKDINNLKVKKLPSFKKQLDRTNNELSETPTPTQFKEPKYKEPLTESLCIEVYVQDVVIQCLLLESNSYNTISLVKLQHLMDMGCLLDFTTTPNYNWPSPLIHNYLDNDSIGELEIVGEVGFDIKFQNSNLNFTVDPIYVVNNQPFDLILGNQFLKENKFVLDSKLSRVRVYLKDRKLPALLKATLVNL